MRTSIPNCVLDTFKGQIACLLLPRGAHRLSVDHVELLDAAIVVELDVLQALVHVQLTTLGCEVVNHGLAQALGRSAIQERHLTAVLLLWFESKDDSSRTRWSV